MNGHPVDVLAVHTVYTTKQYIRDCVAMAREANAGGVKRMRLAHGSVCASIKTSRINGAKWKFNFARELLADARKAKAEFLTRHSTANGGKA